MTAPGWYPDPLGGPAARYWNGTGWDGLPSEQAAPQEIPPDVPSKQRMLVPVLIGAVCLLAGILLVLLWPKHDAPTAAPSTVTLTPPVTITETEAAPTATTTPADRVAKMVRDSMQRKFDSDAPDLGLKVLDVNLVNKVGNEYKGLVEIRAGNGEQQKISIEVTADGDSVLWELPPGALAFAIPTSTPASQAFPVPGADQYGFLDGPRCSMFDTAALVIRTMQSGVVICRVDAPGGYVYHGLRLSDGGQITLDALAMEDGFAAVNPADGTRYEVTRDGLAIYTPDGEVYREAAIATGP